MYICIYTYVCTHIILQARRVAEAVGCADGAQDRRSGVSKTGFGKAVSFMGVYLLFICCVFGPIHCHAGLDKITETYTHV